MNIEDSYMLSWAAKWEGQRKVYSDHLTPAETHKQDDSRIVLSLADMIREADIIVAHNGDRFDLKRVNGRVAIHRQEPLGPVKTIDTLKLSRASFGYAYHHLDSLAQVFLDEHKIKTDFDLWVEAKNGSESAMRKMVTYNRKDVTLLEQVFEAMRPYVKKLPRMVDGTGVACPSCGSDDYQKRGKKFYRTDAFNYQRYQCNNCRRWFKLKSAEAESLDTRPL
jgi:DNA polymerase elongation subunit (family B)